MSQTSDAVTRLGLGLVVLWFVFRGHAKRERQRAEFWERAKDDKAE